MRDKKRLNLEEQVFSAYVFQNTLDDELNELYLRKYEESVVKYLNYMTKKRMVDEAYSFISNLKTRYETLKNSNK